MKNLFEKGPYEEIINRLNSLDSSSNRLWGEMTVNQMMKHCRFVFNIPLAEKPIPRKWFSYLLPKSFTKQLYDDKPWKKSLPTAPILKIKEDGLNFDEEKVKLLSAIQKFHQKDPKTIAARPHPIFGFFTEDQWGQAMYKHLDHHFKQFGV